MRLQFEKPKADKGSLLISIATNIVAIGVLGSITFSYPIAAYLHDRSFVQTERVHYVTAKPRGLDAGTGTANDKRKPKKAPVPVPQIVAPVATPTELPPIPTPSASAGSTTGTGTGSGTGTGVTTGVATGVEPVLPDPRIELRASTLHIPLSTAERNDSAVKAIYSAFREAEIRLKATEANLARLFLWLGQRR